MSNLNNSNDIKIEFELVIPKQMRITRISIMYKSLNREDIEKLTTHFPTQNTYKINGSITLNTLFDTASFNISGITEDRNVKGTFNFKINNRDVIFNKPKELIPTNGNIIEFFELDVKIK